MNAFNRAFAVLISIAWIAACAAVIYLMWSPSREFNVDNRYLDFVFDITVSGSDRVLATLVAGFGIALGAALVTAQALPRRRSRIEGHEAVAASEGRFRELHQRLDELQRRVDNRGEMERRPLAPDQPVVAAERSPERRRWGLLGRNR